LNHILQAELVGDSTESNAQFAANVATDTEATTAFVTAYDQNNSDEPGQYERTGALYIFENSGGTWSQKEQFVPDELGIAEIGGEIAVSGDGTTALLEINSDDVPKAMTFEKSDGSWASGTELAPPMIPKPSDFGRALALSADGRIGIVTEIRSVEIDSESQSGVAYVFEQSSGSWSHQATLYVSDADTFGRSVALSDETTAVVGTYASAYVFRQSDGSWAPDGQLEVGDGDVPVSVAVSADGSTTVIGCHVDGGDDAADPTYVYNRTSGDWTQQAKLVPNASNAGERKTTAVELTDDGSSVVLAAGGVSRTSSGNGDGPRPKDGGVGGEEIPDIPGAVYIFDQSGNSWSQRGVLLGNEADGQGFATAVSVGATTDTILVGDRDESTHDRATGAAFVYRDA
jgi:hypothetical protein